MWFIGKKAPECSIVKVVRTKGHLYIYCTCEKSLHTYALPSGHEADGADHRLNEK